jgi:hypothetical protein
MMFCMLDVPGSFPSVEEGVVRIARESPPLPPHSLYDRRTSMLRGIPVPVSLCQAQSHVGIELLWADIEFLLLSFLHVTAHHL